MKKTKQATPSQIKVARRILGAFRSRFGLDPQEAGATWEGRSTTCFSMIFGERKFTFSIARRGRLYSIELEDSPNWVEEDAFLQGYVTGRIHQAIWSYRG